MTWQVWTYIPCTELVASCHIGTDLGDRNHTGVGIAPDNTDGGVTVAKDRGVDGKRRPMGTDFIVSMKSGDIKQRETQRNNQTVMERKVEKPKLLSIALDIRPPKTAGVRLNHTVLECCLDKWECL